MKRQTVSVKDIPYRYTHCTLEAAEDDGLPNQATFKALLHQQMQSLHGVIYGSLAIDLLRYSPTSTRTADLVLACLDM